MTGDVTLKVYNLNGAAAWGERHSSHTINIYMEGCQNMNRVYFTGTSGTNNITLKDCTFDGTDNSAGPWKKANSCTVYSNAPGSISVEKCDFSNIMAPVNLNNKAAKGTKQNITVKDCKFTDCSTVYNETEKLYAAPIRVLSTAGADSSLTVDTCSFTYSTGKSSANGDKLANFFFESPPVLCFGFFAGQEEQCVFILDKLRNKRGFSHSAPSIQHHKGAAVSRVLTLQSFQFRFTVNEFFHIQHLAFLSILYHGL